MPPRVFAAGTILATAGLLGVHAISPEQAISAGPAQSSADIPLSLLPQTSLDLASALTSGHTILLTLSSNDLLVGEPWSALEADTASLSLLRTTDADTSLILVSTSDAAPTVILADDLIEVSLVPTAASGTLKVSLNGQLAGTFPLPPALTLHGLETGIVAIETASLGLPSVPGRPLLDAPTPPAISTREAALAEFDRLKTTKPGKWVLKDNTLVSVESLVNEKRALFAALMSSRSHCIFLDWELGDDTNDGLSGYSEDRNGHGPKKTWQAAMAAAPVGAVIVMTGGVYSYDESQLTPPKDLTLISLGTVLMNPITKRDEMLASGLLKQGPAGLEFTAKYLTISSE